MPTFDEFPEESTADSDASLPPADWTDASTRGLSSDADIHTEPMDEALPKDSFFQPRTGSSEPDTLFDANASRAPRELKIAREHDGRKLPEGHIINERFEICRCLGEGDVGTVYLVNDLRLKDKKALKLMHPSLVDSDEAARRFISEIKALQQLSHEHIVRVYDYGKTEAGELSFFTMEYVEGVTLAALLKKRGGKLPVEKATGLIVQILDTLAYAHQHTTHRNLKPINIMVRLTGKVVLLNFGISTTASSTGLHPPLARPGDTHYLAPEQRTNPEIPEKRADLYAAGAIYYQMLTGNVPLDGAPAPSRLNRTLPRALDRAIMKSLAPRPELRYPDASTMRDAIEGANRPNSWPRRVAVLLAATALLAALGYLLIQYLAG